MSSSFKGRKPGANNIKKSVLYDSISDKLPISITDWDLVAIDYCRKLGEKKTKTGQEVKRYNDTLFFF
jgi:hypothetical protein